MTAGRGCQWWSGAEHGRPLVSVERDIARDLGIGVGDRLTFDFPGETLPVRVDNIRQVQWDTFRPNFFVVFPPGTLEEFPASYITSFHLPEARTGVLGELLERFPTLTVFDVDALMKQVRGIMDQASRAVRYVFVFSVVAALLVFYAAFRATLTERIRSAAVIRALGGRRAQVQASLAVEFAAMGAVTGLVSTGAAAGIGHLLAARVFNLSLQLPMHLWLVVPAVTALVFVGASLWAVRRVLRTSPMTTLGEIGR